MFRSGTVEVSNSVATHRSALKAHKQSLKHREHNRKFRSHLRTTLKSIRETLDRSDAGTSTASLKPAISLIDKMASKGIIHRNAAGRYKSRLHTRMANKTA